MEYKHFLVFDIESIGLFGDPFAVGWVVIDNRGNELESGYFAVNPNEVNGADDDRKWCKENLPELDITHLSLSDLYNDFWALWLKWKELGAAMITDCGWPVEANFLTKCIATGLTTRKWDGPYPLFDLSSILLSKGKDPVGTFDRLHNELPKHHPLYDARQSARIFIENL
jgi:hypothetical protein